MRLFIDTNVLLDHALVRETGQSYEAKYILSWASQNNVPMFVSAGSFCAFTYVLQKNGVRNSDLNSCLLSYLKLVSIAQTDKRCFFDGLVSGFKDPEDSFQYFSALRQRCDYLITSNLKDFSAAAHQGIAVLSPLQFLTKVLRKQKNIDF